MSDNVTDIGSYAFGNTPLDTIIIIDDNGHARNYSNKIFLPSKLERIEDYAFSDCTELDTIVVPDNCKIIEYHAFIRCPNIHISLYKDTETGLSLTNNSSQVTKRKLTLREELEQQKKLEEKARRKAMADSIAKATEARLKTQKAELMGEVNWAPGLSENKKALIQDLIDQMVIVPEGEFMMGNHNQKITISDCEPLHKVHLSPFIIGKYEVTQKLWGAVMGYNPSNKGGDNRPVENVSWNDCQEFIRKLRKLTGLKFTLPTEAQWEYAARGGDKSRNYYFSGTNNSEQIWYMFTTREGTKDVGLKCANELGIYDMSGNVYEWCLDKYDSYDSHEVKNPKITADWDRYVIRGGSAYNDAADCSVSKRSWATSGYKSRNIGLRLAISNDYKPETAITDEERARRNHPLVKKIRWADNISDKRKRIIAEAVGNMVMVPGGTHIFRGETGRYKPSLIQPGAKIKCKPFYMNKYEVTRDLWLAVLPDFDSFYQPNDELLRMSPTAPVNYLSLSDIKKFLKELNRITGLVFSLPSEAQWEWAARGADKSLGYTYAGTNNRDEISRGHTPNELGIYNLSDGLWERCIDIIKDVNGSTNYMVWRGGGDSGYPASIYQRKVSMHSDWQSDCGFRIILNIN